MKYLVMTKQSASIQLGHMYEHLFSMRIDELFREHDLFPRLDYVTYGKMYYGGVLAVEIELYTDKAIKLAPAIKQLELNCDVKSVSIALSQLIAERETLYASKGFDKLVNALEELHEQPWIELDELGVIDAKQIRRRAGELYVADDIELRARKLHVAIQLDSEFAKNNRQLIPLFRQIAGLIIGTWQDRVSHEFGYYSYEDSFKNTPKETNTTNTFNVPRVRDAIVNVDDVLKASYDIVQHIRNSNALTRYMSELRNTSYMNYPDDAPNYARNYEDTLLLIGTKGWQTIATDANCDLVVKHLTIEVKFGRHKKSQSLS